MQIQMKITQLRIKHQYHSRSPKEIVTLDMANEIYQDQIITISGVQLDRARNISLALSHSLILSK